MTVLGREGLEIEALVTDRYLDSLLIEADHGAPDLAGSGGSPGSLRRIVPIFGWPSGGDRLERGVRLAAQRLTRDLPRFHPSFRFEERLAIRLAEAAAAMRRSVAAGGERDAHLLPFPAPDLEYLADDAAQDLRWIGAHPLTRPLLVGGAVAASALSLAGAAWVAWRRSRTSTTPMARAARAAHAIRARPAHAMRARPAHAMRGRPV